MIIYNSNLSSLFFLRYLSSCFLASIANFHLSTKNVLILSSKLLFLTINQALVQIAVFITKIHSIFLQIEHTVASYKYENLLGKLHSVMTLKPDVVESRILYLRL